MSDAFNKIVSDAMSKSDLDGLLPVVEKEILHYEILATMQKRGFLKKLTFQGGTCLRICYGAVRFSEDLDFTASPDFTIEDMNDLASALSEQLSSRFGFTSAVKSPKALEPGHGINVQKWQVTVQTHAKEERMPKQRIKIEVASLPSYTNEAVGLNQNYDVLPSDYSSVIITAQTLGEIMADKLVALPASVTHIRHRDIWDLHWMKTRRVLPPFDLVERKVLDYSIHDFKDKLQARIDGMASICDSEPFRSEMARFLPKKIYSETIASPSFVKTLVRSNTELLSEVLQQLYKTKFKF